MENKATDKPKLETITKGKYTNKVIDGTAFMLLNKSIGLPSAENPQEQTISGPEFADEAYYHKSKGNKITVKINNMGGNVRHGWDMVDSIIETKAETENVGFAYSMAGIALIVGSYRKAYAHSRAMIHSPRTADGKANFHTDLVKNQFRAILKNHTKFTDDEINEMIDSGKDYFFDAKQMLDKGMIDEIVSTGYGRTTNMSDIQAYEYYNSLITETNNEEMEIFAKLFGGKTDTENIVNAVQMKAENETLKAQKESSDKTIADLQAKVAAFEAEKGKVDATKKATDLIENAVKAGKLGAIAEADKAKLIENAVANFDAAEIMIKNMKAQKTAAAAAIIDGEAKGSDKTYEWLANNAPDELNRIATEDPELFNKLSDEYIASKKAKS